LRRTELEERTFSSCQEGSTHCGERQTDRPQHSAERGITQRSGHRSTGQGEYGGDPQRPPGRSSGRRGRSQYRDEDQQHAGGTAGQACEAGVPRSPRPPGPACAGGDRVDHVVVLELGPLRGARHQVQHLAVADAVRAECEPEVEQRTIGAAQHPAASQRALVGQLLTGVHQEPWHDLGDC
jgi:hypothetical protein